MGGQHPCVVLEGYKPPRGAVKWGLQEFCKNRSFFGPKAPFGTEVVTAVLRDIVFRSLDKKKKLHHRTSTGTAVEVDSVDQVISEVPAPHSKRGFK